MDAHSIWGNFSRGILQHKSEGACIDDVIALSFKCYVQIFLAASPPTTYKSMEFTRYVILPTPNSTRQVELSCAIMPGALFQKYRVRWIQQAPKTMFFGENMYSVTTSVNPSLPSISYQCNVTIQHSSIVSASYTPPPIVVHNKGKRVIDTAAAFESYIVHLLLFSTVISERRH